MLPSVFNLQDDILTVIRRVDENWAEGMLGDKIGIFPISYVEVRNRPDSFHVNVPSHYLKQMPNEDQKNAKILSNVVLVPSTSHKMCMILFCLWKCSHFLESLNMSLKI